MRKAVLNNCTSETDLIVRERSEPAQSKNRLEFMLEIRSGVLQLVSAAVLGVVVINSVAWAQNSAIAPTAQASDARLDEAKKLNAQVVALYGRGQYSAALDPARKALEIREEVLGAAHPSTGASLNNLALLYQSMGQYAQALPLYQRALAISENAEGAEHPDTGMSLNNLAALYRLMGQYAPALPLYQRALAISEKTLGAEHPSTGRTLNNLASLYESMGQYAQALPLYHRSLTLSEKVLGVEHPSTGTRLNNLAGLYESMGRYAQALPLYQRALAISEKAEGAEHPSTGRTLNNLAALYRSMGQYAQALPLYHRALAISEKAEGPEHPSAGRTLNNLAALYRSMGQYAQALPLYHRALAISEKAEGPEHPSTGTRLNNLAGLYESMGQYAQALPLYQRALAISEKAEGPEHPSTATRLNNLAVLYESMGQYAKALPLYQRALAISEKSHVPELRWFVLGNLMVVHSNSDAAGESLRNLPLSVWYGKQAVSTLQSVRSGMVSLDQSLQRGFLKTVEGNYTRLANLLIESGRIPEAEQVLAMLKEKELGDLLRSGLEDRKARVDEVGNEPKVSRENAELVARGVKDSTELAALERRKRSGEKLPQAEDERRQQLLKAAEQWRAEYQQWLAGLSKRFTDTRSAGDVRAAGEQGTLLQTLVRTDPGAVGLHYVVTDDQVAIIVATARGSFGRFSKVSRAELNQQISALRQAIVSRADVQPASRALHRMLIEPIAKDLDDAQAKTLVLSLTDTLRYLPFAALSDGNQYLIDKYALSLYASAGSSKPQTAKAPWQVAALGLTQAKAGYVALPAVRGELQGIVKSDAGQQGLLPGRIDMDEAFGRPQFESALTGPNNVVHIASHFTFKPGDENGSVLLIGQGDPISLGQLAVMDFAQIEQLTLSACETATGGGVNENGAEVEGLAAAVQKQGAQAVLATLWKVADESTGALMREFYAGRATGDKPLSRAQALRRAQLMLIWGNGSTTTDVQRGGTREGSDKAATTQQVTDPSRPWAHPFYWAPFVLSGNWL